MTPAYICWNTHKCGTIQIHVNEGAYVLRLIGKRTCHVEVCKHVDCTLSVVNGL
jgi:hypothetical protein